MPRIVEVRTWDCGRWVSDQNLGLCMQRTSPSPLPSAKAKQRTVHCCCRCRRCWDAGSLSPVGRLRSQSSLVFFLKVKSNFQSSFYINFDLQFKRQFELIFNLMVRKWMTECLQLWKQDILDLWLILRVFFYFAKNNKKQVIFK